MPMNTKVTPGLRRTPNNVCPVAGTLSAGVWRGPTKKHSKALLWPDSMERVVQASGRVRNRVAGVVSMDQKQPT